MDDYTSNQQQFLFSYAASCCSSKKPVYCCICLQKRKKISQINKTKTQTTTDDRILTDVKSIVFVGIAVVLLFLSCSHCLSCSFCCYCSRQRRSLEYSVESQTLCLSPKPASPPDADHDDTKDKCCFLSCCCQEPPSNMKDVKKHWTKIRKTLF